MNKHMKRALLSSAIIGFAGVAQADIKIGLNNDMSGVQSAGSGPGSKIAAEMAIEDMGGSVNGEKIEFIIGDNQAKPELEVSISRRWYEDEDVDAIVGINLTPAAIETVHLAERFDKVALVSDAGSSRLVKEDCTPNHVHWGWNTSSYSAIVPQALMAKGHDSFFFLTADYTFGHDMVAEATAQIEKAGGSVLGNVLHPFGVSDFSAYMLQAQASGASAVLFTNSGADTVTAIKQAGEFGMLAGEPVVVPMIFTLVDVEALGLEATQNLRVPMSFYWGRDDESRAWSERFKARYGKMPTYFQAQVYSTTYNYLKAVEIAGTKDAKTVIKTLKSMKIEDVFAKNAYVREDGQLIHDMYLVRVKTPEESEGEFDYFEVEATIPGDEVFQPMDPSTCKILQN